MSILTRGLPNFVVCRGERYEVETDFRAWIDFYERAGERDIPGLPSPGASSCIPPLSVSTSVDFSIR